MWGGARDERVCDDPVVGTQPFLCTGRPIRKIGLFGAVRYVPRHDENISAVLIVHRSGRTRVVCPICGSWDNTMDYDEI